MPRIPQYPQPERLPNLPFPEVRVEGLSAPGMALSRLGGAITGMADDVQHAMNRQMRMQQEAVEQRQEQVNKLTKNYWDTEFYRWQGDDTIAGQEFAKKYGDHGIGYTKAEAARLDKSIKDFIGKVPKELQQDYSEKAMQYRLGRLKGAANDEDRMGNEFAVTSGTEIWQRAYAPRLTGDDKADEAVLNDFITTQVTNGPGNASTKERLAITVREDFARRKFRALYERDPDGAEALATRATSLASNARGVRQSVLSAWDRVQQKYGRSFDIVSGYRDPEYNARVGGAKRSQHIHGNAIDINTSMLSPAEKVRLIEIASAEGFQGIGVYKNNIHLDMGTRRAWGPNYSFGTVPGWARVAVAKHMANTARAPAAAPAPAGPPSPGGDGMPQWASWLPADEARAFVSERKKEEEAAVKEQRETALKDIYDAAYKGQPIDEMLEERREIISASDYGRLKALAARQRKEAEGDAGSPDREVYADLLQRAVEDDDQGEVQDDAIDAYREGYISRTDLNKLFSLSRNATSETLARPWAREVRKTLSAQLRPASLAEPEQYERRMQAVFALDDWMRENPKATRDQAVQKAKELAVEYAKIDVDDMRKSLPMPYGASIGRYNLTPEQLPLSASLLRDAYAKKKITEDQLRQQVEVLRKWQAVFDEEVRNGRP